MKSFPFVAFPGTETQGQRETLPAEEVLRDYVDVPKFLEACKKCPNYAHRWSCPPFDFNPKELWKEYSSAEFFCVKLSPVGEAAKKAAGEDAREYILPYMRVFEDNLRQRQSMHPGALLLAPGACRTCRTCARESGNPCRMPEACRHSPEALGLDVSALTEKLFGWPIQWAKPNEAPEYFTLLGAILK